MSEPYLSVIIPTFNEEQRLGPALVKIVNYLKGRDYSSEIIVADDGSRDRTSAVAEEKLAGFPHLILREPENRGKGWAVKRGMLGANGKYLLFSDADLSTPIEEVEKLLDRLRAGFDLAIGSRGLPESNIKTHQNFLRETMGKIFNRIARIVSFKEIQDSQCGFKCFRRESALRLFSAQKLKSFSFDAEILYLAQKKRYRIAEVPVTWENSPHSRVHILKDSLRMLFDVLRIRWLHR